MFSVLSVHKRGGIRVTIAVLFKLCHLGKRAVGLQLKSFLVANVLTVTITEICTKILIIFDSQEFHQTFKFHASTNNLWRSRQRHTRGMSILGNLLASVGEPVYDVTPGPFTHIRVSSHLSK